MSENLHDAPNQQVVRPDASHPADEGEGGSVQGDVKAQPEPEALQEPRAEQDLDELSKDELLELARARGISPANATMTKDELRAALEKG